MRTVLAAAAIIALGITGCPADAGTCATDEACGAGGVCEATGFCSATDPTCDTGRRYGDEAPAGQAGQCVQAQGTTTGAIPPSSLDTDDTDGATSSPTGDGQESGGTAGDECTVVSVEPALLGYGNGLYTTFDVTPNLGDVVISERFTLQFRTHVPGTFTLGELDEASLVSCLHCITLDEDATKTYFAVEGQLTVLEGSAPLADRFEANLIGLRLAEVEIDPDTSATVLVEGGDCVIVADTTLTALEIAGWRCATGYYQDGSECDCGCGIADPDCPTAMAGSCNYCETPGSCSLGHGDCPAAIDPANNATCDPMLWTCNPAAFGAGDGICDCGCGLIDPDCESTAVDACTVCGSAGSCAVGMGCAGYIDLTNNGQCGAIPGWTCPDEYYDAQDGCDCGCGIPDPDCPTMAVAECEFCNDLGSCTEEVCPTDALDPANPSQCVPPG